MLDTGSGLYLAISEGFGGWAWGEEEVLRDVLGIPSNLYGKEFPRALWMQRPKVILLYL